MDRIDAMRSFVAVAEHGSLTAAARSLGVPLASLSRRLAALEKRAGVRLVARSTRRAALTAAGERHLSRCREILAAVALADAELASSAGELVDSLAVSAPVAFGRLHLVPVVCELQREHARIEVRLSLSDRNADLIEEGIDAAVRIGPLADSALTAIRVGRVRRVFCASPAYLARRGTPASPAELPAHDCIAVTSLGPGNRWSFAAGRTVRVQTRIGVGSSEAGVDAAIAGAGIARLLSYQVAAAVASGALVRVLERHEPEPLPVHILHGEERAPRAALRAFLDLARRRLAESLARIG